MIQPELEGSTQGYPLVSVEVLRYDKRSKSENMGIVSTEMELILDQTNKVLLLAWDRVSEIKDAFDNKQYKPEDVQELFRKLLDDLQNIREELAEFINSPSWNRPAVYDDNDDDAHIPTTVDTKFEPEEAPLETEEFEASEPLDTRITSSHSSASSDSTIPILNSGGDCFVSLLFCKRYISSYKTPSSSSSLTLPIRNRYRGTSELVENTRDESSNSNTKREGSKDDGHSSEDEGPVSEEEEETAPEGHQSVLEHERVKRIFAFRYPTLVTWVDPKDGEVYTDILTYVPPVAPVQTSPSPEWSFGSLLVSPSSPTVLTLVASPVTTQAATVAVDKDEFLEIIEKRRERLELIDRAARIERRQESRGE
nr:hypothetical protein [Tanacetum cinerariifolium]